jgi:molybdopterin molybdotransferase
MKSFFKVKTVPEVLEIIETFDPLATETIGLVEARGRVLRQRIEAGENIPAFDRSAMDGYAVRAKDTFGASESIPALFSVVGEVHMGQSPDFTIGPGETTRVWTGGMIPSGADAVVMLEYARQVDDITVELARPAAPYDHVIRTGEDVALGDVLAPVGRRLRPQDLGLLAALGVSQVDVTKIPKVAIISTGDEVIPVEQKPNPGQVRDVNTYTLGAMIEAAHGQAIRLGLVSDDPAGLRDAVAKGLDSADVVVLSGGSSVGVRDYTLDVIESFDRTEVLFHGVSVSPGKPTLMARRDHQSLWGLPGHIASAMVVCDLFLRPLLRRLSGETETPSPWRKNVPAILTRSVPSVHGREDYIRVRLENNGQGPPLAHPILGKSGLIATMVKADGLVKIGLNEEGRAKGTPVEVALFD